MRKLALMLAIVAIACGDDDGVDTDGGREDAGGSSEPCVTDDDCDDGVFCNGTEACMPSMARADRRGCVRGAEPCLEGQACDEERELCATACDVTPDADGDGAIAIECGGDDCDDGDPKRRPGAAELCDLEGVDEDCDDATFGTRDADNDGFVDARCCNGEACGNDCDDGRPGVNPATSEVCDGFDNDCDGSVDEGVMVAGYRDADRDLHGDPSMPVSACPGASAFSLVDDDCDDTNPRRHGAQVEICDTLDNDCDGRVDEAPTATTWYGDADGDGFGSPDTAIQISCEPLEGFSLLGTDCDDTRSGINPGADEVCNGRDDDCNGRADFTIASGDTEDDDEDGFADARCGVFGTDCDDRDPATYAGATEICDGRDNDCDGLSDDGTESTTWYPDFDQDGYGDADGTPIRQCEPPRGHVLRVGDCDDSNRNIHPGAVDDDCNGRDGDCDGRADEDADLVEFYPDDDEDGFGDTLGRRTGCTVPSRGFVTVGGDCDDDDDAVRPDATELCNGVDDDCDGEVDDGFETVTCGRGACMRTVGLCEDGVSVRCTPGFPSAEICNGLDDDCNGVVDDTPVADDACGDPSTGVFDCDAGDCRVVACLPGFGDCNDFPLDGCEADLATSLTSCGSCGHGCRAGDRCVDGVCQLEPLDLAAGENHTCLVLGDGSAWCWGANNRGQLGDATTTLRDRATRVVASGGATFGGVAAIGAGVQHTCAATTSGSLFCWGDNSQNQTLRGSGTVLIPTPSRDGGVADAIRVDGGAWHTCFLRGSGIVTCFGDERFAAVAGQCAGGCNGDNMGLTNVSNVAVASLLSVGRHHGVALRGSPSPSLPVAFGRGSEGQLARGTTILDGSVGPPRATAPSDPST
ncbi:MAG: hypothetical protein H6721_20860 [Sandaracinus sp.]|nr:hypothetical protein [Sandaracinus sp.]